MQVKLAGRSWQVERRDVPQGGSAVRLSDQELEDKFMTRAAAVLERSVMARIRDLVARLDVLDDLDRLAAGLEGAPP